MSKDIYIFDISRSTEVADIFSMVEDARADSTLTPADQEEVALYGRRRVSQLNAESVGPQKARWP
jgi:hypothetical protein